MKKKGVDGGFKILIFFSALDHFNAFWWAGWVGVCALCSGSTSLFESNGHVMSLFFRPSFSPSFVVGLTFDCRVDFHL